MKAMRMKLSVHMLFLLVGILAASCLAFADTCSSGFTGPDSGGQTVCDLSAEGSTATINGGQFEVIVPQPTGTGVFDPFLRIQQTSNNTFEAGWNENFTNTPDITSAGLDSVASIHTHSLLLSNLAIVNHNGVDSYEFTLDLAEPASNTNLISLNNVTIFVGSNADPSDAAACNASNYLTCIPNTAGDALVWNMDAGLGGNSTVTLDSNVHPGNGLANMTLYVPVADFGNNTGYVIFYSQFGTPPGDNSSDASFEEWAAALGPNAPPPVPEPGSLVLFGTGLISIAGVLRRKFRA